MTFVRIFVNQESTEIYTQLFHTVFNAIAKETGQPIHWKHLHQSGFGSIVIDMDSKQMSGMKFCLIYYECITNILRTWTIFVGY